MSVFLKKSGSSFRAAPAAFAESIVDQMSEHITGKKANAINVQYELSHDGLILQSSQQLTEKQTIPLHRAPFCPVALMDDEMKANIPDDISSRGVKLGVAVLLESSDHCVLVTRRSRTMRTFPHVWVPPGGHSDPGETFFQAGSRELKEETGIDMAHTEEVKVLGFWESVYPPKLEMGYPKRHHVVAYLHFKAKKSVAELTANIELQQNEADACAWLCNCLVHEIVLSDYRYEEALPEQWECTSPTEICSRSSNLIDGIVITDTGVEKGVIIPTAPMLQTSADAIDCERLSTGTKFALMLWLFDKNKSDLS